MNTFSVVSFTHSIPAWWRGVTGWSVWLCNGIGPEYWWNPVIMLQHIARRTRLGNKSGVLYCMIFEMHHTLQYCDNLGWAAVGNPDCNNLIVLTFCVLGLNRSNRLSGTQRNPGNTRGQIFWWTDSLLLHMWLFLLVSKCVEWQFYVSYIWVNRVLYDILTPPWFKVTIQGPDFQNITRFITWLS